jgi:MarR family transcriptional regulator, transcriptional regulator for hemolysin
MKPLVDATLGLGFLLDAVSRLHRKRLNLALGRLGFTNAQSILLLFLAAHDEGLTQTDIARVLTLSKAAIVQLVDRLEASGHLRRNAASEDRRLKRIALTARGRKAVVEIQATVHLSESSIFPSDLHEERASIETFLRRIRLRLLAAPNMARCRGQGSDAPLGQGLTPGVDDR